MNVVYNVVNTATLILARKSTVMIAYSYNIFTIFHWFKQNLINIYSLISLNNLYFKILQFLKRIRSYHAVLRKYFYCFLFLFFNYSFSLFCFLGIGYDHVFVIKDTPLIYTLLYFGFFFINIYIRFLETSIADRIINM